MSLAALVPGFDPTVQAITYEECAGTAVLRVVKAYSVDTAVTGNVVTAEYAVHTYLPGCRGCCEAGTVPVTKCICSELRCRGVEDTAGSVSDTVIAETEVGVRVIGTHCTSTV